MQQILVTLVRSTNNSKKKQLATVEALGLRKIGDQALHEDNAAIRGMCAKVAHLITADLVEVEEVTE